MRKLSDAEEDDHVYFGRGKWWKLLRSVIQNRGGMRETVVGHTGCLSQLSKYDYSPYVATQLTIRFYFI